MFDSLPPRTNSTQHLCLHNRVTVIQIPQPRKSKYLGQYFGNCVPRLDGSSETCTRNCVTFWFLVLNFKEAKKSQSLTFSRCKKQMFHRRVEISIVLIPGTFQLGWKAAIWRTSSQILCSGQDVRGGGGADLCASTPVVIWRWTLDCIKLQKFDESQMPSGQVLGWKTKNPKKHGDV